MTALRRRAPLQTSSVVSRHGQFALKSCPKCHGDLARDADDEVSLEFYTCLQCGWHGPVSSRAGQGQGGLE
jgi:predicted RNA-binding Zn-ribbon protein involved in translation (DUF1610 family)